MLGAAIGWVVNKVMDWGWYALTKDDFSFNRSPEPTSSAFHNSYTSPYEVSNSRKFFTANLVGRYGTPFGLDEYLLTIDLNYPEASQIQRECEAGYYDGPLVPVYQRVPVKERHQPVVARVASQYRLRNGDYDAEYINGLADRLGNEHLGVGVKVNGQEKYLML